MHTFCFERCQPIRDLKRMLATTGMMFEILHQLPSINGSFQRSIFLMSPEVDSDNQVIPGNDQNTIPTNQEATGSKLDRTSQLTFCGSRGHLKSFSGDFLV